jgi:carbamate kinase
VRVNENDMAWKNPFKPIGGFMDEAESKQREKDLGWNVVEDAGRGWREAKQYLAEGTHFARGSMAPKIQAIIWFLEAGGKQALVTNPENIGRALKGETGTWIIQ